MTGHYRIYGDIYVYRGRDRERGEIVVKCKSDEEHLLHKGFLICNSIEQKLLIAGFNGWASGPLRTPRRCRHDFFACKYPHFWRKCPWLSFSYRKKEILESRQ